MYLSVKFYEVIVPSIVLLALPRYPPTVCRFVIAINIDSVNREILLISVRHCPIIESLEVIKPLVAHRDASRTVEAISAVIGVVTPRFDVAIYCV